MDNVAIGTVTGTGANLDVNLGWIPSHVEVVNVTDTANVHPSLRWVTGFADASAIKRSSSTVSRITTGGITPLGKNAADTIRGFRIGNDSAVNVATNVLVYIAQRSAEPSR